MNSPWVKPATLNGGKATVAVIQSHVGYIFDFFVHMGFALAVDTDRHLIEDVEYNGDVVGGQVPGDIDVRLIETEVATAGADVENVAKVSGVYDLLDLHD